MGRLTDAEKRALREAAARSHEEPPLSRKERFVAPTPEARRRYIEWVTAVSRIATADKPVRFNGNDWRL